MQIGIDAGGTQVRIAWTGEHPGVIQVAAAADGGPEPVLPTLAALPTAAHIVAGITKISRAGVVARWEQALRQCCPQAQVRIVPDFVVAFHGALPTARGVLVIAGTGSVVYGEDGVGGTVRLGGRGWEYGDEGSGAYLTTELLRRTIRACDGLYPQTPLTRFVVAQLGESDAGRLAEAARQRAQTEGRGFLVPLVLEQARGGESEARELFVGAAGWLARYTRAAAQQLKLASDYPVAIGLVGGLWEAGELLRQPYQTVLERWLPQCTLQAAAATPVEGALRLAGANPPPYNAA